MTEVPLSNELMIKDIKEEANPAYELTKEENDPAYEVLQKGDTGRDEDDFYY